MLLLFGSTAIRVMERVGSVDVVILFYVAPPSASPEIENLRTALVHDERRNEATAVGTVDSAGCQKTVSNKPVPSGRYPDEQNRARQVFALAVARAWHARIDDSEATITPQPRILPQQGCGWWWDACRLVHLDPIIL